MEQHPISFKEKIATVLKSNQTFWRLQIYKENPSMENDFDLHLLYCNLNSYYILNKNDMYVFYKMWLETYNRILIQNSTAISRNGYYVTFALGKFLLQSLTHFISFLISTLTPLYKYKFPANLASIEINIDYFFIPQRRLYHYLQHFKLPGSLNDDLKN